MEKDIKDLLSEHEFFRGMAPAALELIAGCGKNVKVDEGRYLGREGEKADTFFAVRHGRVSIEVHSPERGGVIIQTLGPGEILGWSWIFPPYRWLFDARAVEVTRAVSFDGACLRKKCDADPAFGYELMKRFAVVIARRLEATRLQLLDVYGKAAAP